MFSTSYFAFSKIGLATVKNTSELCSKAKENFETMSN